MNIKQLKVNINFIKKLAKELNIPETYINIDKSIGYNYYPNYVINVSKNRDNISFKLTESPTGCGTMLFHSFVYSISTESQAKLVKDCLDFTIKQELNKVGLLICSLGSNYYGEKEDNLKKILGFEEIIEYSNPNMSHGGQKIFIKKINQSKAKKGKAVELVEDLYIDEEENED